MNVKNRNKLIILIGLLAILVITIFTIIQPKIVAYQREKEKEQTYQNGIDLIKQEKWVEANKIFGDMVYKNSYTLYMYTYAKDKYDKDKAEAYGWIKVISEDYNGEFATEIKSFKEQLKNDKDVQREMKELEDALAKAKANSNQSTVSPEPRIGMTSQQVLSSSWGKPYKVNRTTTANRVSEQWVYSLDRFVYLRDGIVYAIQDSN